MALVQSPYIIINTMPLWVLFLEIILSIDLRRFRGHLSAEMKKALKDIYQVAPGRETTHLTYSRKGR
jgi:hypothetical protein